MEKESNVGENKGAGKNNVKPPEAASETYFSIEDMALKKKMPDSIYMGVCTMLGWKPGKNITEQEFDLATEKFLGQPMGKEML